MADHSNIEWTDATWNPITGCSIVSPGCANCYAMKLAGTRLRHHPSRKGLTIDSKAGPVWNGQVRLNEGWLMQPLEWSKPRMIFVCAHGDLFHESVPDEWIDRVFAVMAIMARQHTFQVLTKRASRMQSYFTARMPGRALRIAEAIGSLLQGSSFQYLFDDPTLATFPWPLPNVWLGVSAERQTEAAQRIPLLLQTPATVRFLSAEPLLGEIDLTDLYFCDALGGRPKLDWVIVGGENGPRPMHPDWARSLRNQCADAGVSFFFKQWGSWKNGRRVGKKVAGRLLDDVLHNDMPERVA